MPRAATVLATAVAVALSAAVGVLACATSGPAKSKFEREFQRYLSQSNQKAMAVAGEPADGRWTYGYGYRFRSTGAAIDKAFEECERRRRDFGIAGECRIYAVNSRIVEGDPELEARYGRQ